MCAFSPAKARAAAYVASFHTTFIPVVVSLAVAVLVSPAFVFIGRTSAAATVPDPAL